MVGVISSMVFKSLKSIKLNLHKFIERRKRKVYLSGIEEYPLYFIG